jgi:hypothetical protein
MSGFTSWPNSAGIHHFAQQSDGYRITTWYSIGTVSTGTRHPYRSLYSPGCGCVQSTVDTTTVMSSSFEPYLYWLWPFHVKFMGDVTYEASNIPGLGVAQTYFQSLGAQRASDHVIEPMPCVLGAISDRQKLALQGDELPELQHLGDVPVNFPPAH